MNRSERLSTQDLSPISRAAAAPHGTSQTAVPRLSAPFAWATAASAVEPLVESEPAFSTAEILQFVDDVLGRDEDIAQAHVAALVARGVAVESIYLDLLTPTARHLGELWDDDSCDFVDVTVALGRLQRVLRDLSHQFVGHAVRAEAGRILLSCIPGEQHTLGMFMVSEFFVRDGWEVSLGAPISECDIGSLLRDEWFDVVGFSVACNSRLSYLSREIPRLRRQSRNRRVAFLVGGRVFADQPEMVGRVHADGCASDARSAPALARRLTTVALGGPSSRRQ